MENAPNVNISVRVDAIWREKFNRNARMLKKIPTSELRIGMYVHDLGRAWMDHPFSVNRFQIKDMQTIQKIVNAGIRELTIDASKGLAGPAPVVAASTPVQAEPVRADAKPGKVSVADERGRAKVLYQEATSIIHNLMSDARLGKQVELQSLEPLAERMVQSVFRNHHALTGISRIKTKDEYTFMHCVSVAGLLVTFAREQGFSEEDIHQVAIGGLIHDIGKTMTPHEVLNKPGKLEPEEFEIMKGHVTHSREILEQTLGISKMSMDIAVLHHERMDGSGYPRGLSGEEILLESRIIALADVVEAMSSHRPYRPSLGIGKALEEISANSGKYYEPTAVDACLRLFKEKGFEYNTREV